MPQSEEIRLQVIPWGSPAYEQAIKLRDQVLRQPLGMSIYNDNLDGEKEDIHLLATLNAEAVGVLLLRKVDGDTLQMKQVAVDDRMQGKGVGRLLVAYAEQLALQHHARKILLHARMTAVPFYEKLGYTGFGEFYSEVGIPHWSMQKVLSVGTTG